MPRPPPTPLSQAAIEHAAYGKFDTLKKNQNVVDKSITSISQEVNGDWIVEILYEISYKKRNLSFSITLRFNQFGTFLG